MFVNGSTPLDRINVSSFILSVLLAAIAARPLVDLLGRYEGEALNPGGALGILFAVGALALALVSRIVWDRYTQALLILVAFLSAIGLAHVALGEDTQAAAVSLARFVTGYSAALLVPVVASMSPVPARMRVQARTCIVALIAASTVPIAIAWLQLGGLIPFTYFDWYAGSPIGRPSGGYFQPNSLGRLLAFLALYIGALRAAGLMSSRLMYLAWLVLGATVFISTHRTSLVITALVMASSVAVIYFRPYRYIRFLRAGFLTLVATVLTSTAVVLVLPPAVLETVGRSVQLTARVIGQVIRTDAPDNPVNLRGRSQYWSSSVEYLQQLDPITAALGSGSPPFEAHNELLNTAMIFGVLGVAVLGLVHFLAIAIAWRASSRLGRKFLSINLAYYLLFSITLQPMDYPFFMWLYFGAMLLIISVFGRENADTRKAPSAVTSKLYP